MGGARFRAYLIGVLGDEIGMQILFIAVTWQIFITSRSPFDLGLVGLSMFLPAVVFVVFSGMVADQLDRRAVIMVCRGIELACCGAFFVLIALDVRIVGWYFAAVFVVGTARALSRPAEKALLPNIVRGERYVNAQAAYASGREIVVIVGPAVGGLLLSLSAKIAIVAAAAAVVVSVAAYAVLRVERVAGAGTPQSWRAALDGFRFVAGRPVIFGAISLDLFAILFGGATALLPIYADAILHVGPIGLGYLRSAPSVGAALVATVLMRHSPRHKVGPLTFVAVIGFGIATIVFGLSRTLWISIGALIVMGAFDVVGGVIRNGFIQLNTPDPMRGRVTAIQSVFTTASNELGAFESGTLAALIGTVPAVVAGGVASLAVAALWAHLFPALRNADTLQQTGAAT